MTQKSQVPELNETHLVEGKKELQNVGDCHGDNHFRLLSNMMEEETHIIDNISDYAGICQVLFDEINGVEDQSVGSGRAEIAISGLSQSSQYRLGKSDGEPGTPLPATNPDRQNQKVGLGNLSLNTLNKFKASLKNNARVWYSMYIEKRVQDLHSAEGWKTVKSKFLTYFNPIGSTKEQQIKAWKELKWKPEEEKLTDFVFRFSQLAHELGYSDEQQVSHFVLCIPRGMYLYLEGARTVPDAVENLRKGIALGGMETFGAISKPVQDESKPTVPFMVKKENRTQSSTEDTLRVVKESIHDSMYESSKTLVKQLDKIGDKLANVVEDFQKKQISKNSRGRNRDRSNSRSRDNSRENYRDSYRIGGRDYYRNRSRDSRDNSRDRDRDRGRGQDRSNSREKKKST